MSTGAMFPGTFDPITRGHEDLIRRAAVLFEPLVVAIAKSPSKTPMFSLQERADLVKKVLSDLVDVKIIGYEGLTVEFAKANGLGVIIRGVRAVTDFEYEFQLAAMNRHLTEEVDTVFLTPEERNTFISSSLIREIAELGGDVASFVHPYVQEKLKKKVC
ncbi:MAG: pantetheine-phosphate adenylyltransferase [Gammaproteobacteria bacterium]|jgi:pantetheine-phosphate adenylyltransferase